MNYELKLEVCCADLQSVRAAVEGGAHRVELCQALGLDGLTPSAGMIEQAVSMGIHVQVLIRPREGDFVYDRDEVLCMQRDIRHARELGAGGVVIGALRPDGSIDEETTRRLVDEAEGMSITFHRAFDVCARPEEALEQIISLGCHRLLTSGQHPTALEGAEVIKQLVQYSTLHSPLSTLHSPLTILAGGGITPLNAQELVAATGVTELHGSCKTLLPDGTLLTDPEQVRQLKLRTKN